LLCRHRVSTAEVTWGPGPPHAGGVASPRGRQVLRRPATSACAGARV